jgi:hypothetical protein
LENILVEECGDGISFGTGTFIEKDFMDFDRARNSDRDLDHEG